MVTKAPQRKRPPEKKGLSKAELQAEKARLEAELNQYKNLVRTKGTENEKCCKDLQWGEKKKAAYLLLTPHSIDELKKASEHYNISRSEVVERMIRLIGTDLLLAIVMPDPDPNVATEL